ncbi:winged helix-turn-helix transcriptional regulator [Streptomyces sp. B1866]|uniref:winged helix-turn-helix transcriptional regulator n=1 Tax=Streptomyces sp. B1866 TaxID=3075431 RepID=UPI0028923732|nr:winged helix-turn-helix transcriptional regulator [Streptomyces sp. B1866]MDT3395318.1 winged helix-turn-helix transcriptional regulator [Streptomyces sp. B1866]
MTGWPSTADPGHLEQTISRLAPRWTAWTLLTLRQHDQLRMGELSEAVPWVSYTNLCQQVLRLQYQGLIDRVGFGQYRLTDTARRLEPVFQALSAWSHTHYPAQQPTAQAEQIETALARLRGRGTTPVLAYLAQHPTATFSQLQRSVGAPGSAYARLQRMQTDALLVRTHYGRYELTRPGAALGPVYHALHAWSPRPATEPANPAALAPAARTAHARASAAQSRTTTSLNGLFSHAPHPQPAVPTPRAAASPPRRSR